MTHIPDEGVALRHFLRLDESKNVKVVKIVKIVKNCQKLSKLSKWLKIVENC